MSPRILHVLQTTEGGGAAQALALATHSAEGGHEVAVAAPPPGVSAPDRVRSLVLPRAPILRAAAIFARARRSDLVHAHGARAAAWSLPALVLRPSIVTFHGLHPLRRPAGPVYRALARAWVKLVASAANAVICVAETERRDVAALGIPASKLRTVRNAVAATGPASDAERAAARASLGLDDGTFAVAVAARLVEQKDPLTAVRAVAGLDGVLLFAGDGPLRRDVEAAAAANVRVLGTLANVRSAIAASDVVLSTSLWEGLPLSLLEAMWAGRPIVASDAPGNVEAVGDAAMLVPRGDADGFRAALERLRDPIERTRLARLARTRVEREFEFERMLAETDDVYGDVLTARLAVGESLS